MPMSYSKALADLICERVADGSNLNRICQMDDMPSRQSVYKWMREHEDFADKYARARETRADWRADNIDDIVEQMMSGSIDPQCARVAIDAQKWQAGKEAPKRYGERMINEHMGEGGGPILVATGIESNPGEAQPKSAEPE